MTVSIINLIFRFIKEKKLHYISEQDEPKAEELPLLAIEIVSPSQTMNELIKKADFYVESGFQSVWIVHPQTHSITVKSEVETKIYHQGILEDITGIKVDLGVIFED
ncbi:MAG: Uma2 family endonuclease [Candidatus Electrothrix sp. MAN1_4]|nr:Uma2 family endonuclease [Candidatus Electrothrix sp. MAN1_4]